MSFVLHTPLSEMSTNIETFKEREKKKKNRLFFALNNNIKKTAVEEFSENEKGSFDRSGICQL